MAEMRDRANKYVLLNFMVFPDLAAKYAVKSTPPTRLSTEQHGFSYDFFFN
jgi:hypothetical protein